VVELRVDGQAMVPAPTAVDNVAGIAADEGGDGAAGHLADDAIVGIRDVDVALGVHGHARWMVQFGTGGGRGVAQETLRTVAGHCRDCSARRHLADPVVDLVGDVKVTRGVQRYAQRVVELAGVGCDCIRRIAGGIVAGEGGNDVCRRLRPAHSRRENGCDANRKDESSSVTDAVFHL